MEERFRAGPRVVSVRRPRVSKPIAGARAEPRHAIIRIGEPAAVEREAAAAYALGQSRLEAFQLGDLPVDP